MRISIQGASENLALAFGPVAGAGGIKFITMKMGGDLSAQGVDSRAGGGDGAQGMQDGWVPGVGEVALVEDAKCAGVLGEQLSFVVIGWMVGAQNDQHQVCRAGLMVALVDGGAFEGVGGPVDAGGVDEQDRQAVDVGDFTHPVAGGAREVGRDRALAGEELVGQRRLADVGCADDRHSGGIKQVTQRRVIQTIPEGCFLLFRGLMEEGLLEMSPRAGLGQQRSQSQFAFGQGQMRFHLAQKGLILIFIQHPIGEGQVGRVDGIEAEAFGQFKDTMDNP